MLIASGITGCHNRGKMDRRGQVVMRRDADRSGSVSLPSTRLKEAIVPISSQKLSLALHKAILALEVLNRKDGRWMLYGTNIIN